MRRDRWGRLGVEGVAAGALVIAVCSLSGCESSGAGVPDSEQTRAAAPHRGGVFRLVEEAPQSLDPAELQSVYDSCPVGQIFDGLVKLDPGLNVVPALAPRC